MAYRLDVKEREKGTYMIIEKKYWDKEKKKSVTKHIKTVGYAQNYQKEYPDPVAHFRAVVEQMNADEKEDGKLTIEIDMNEDLPQDSHARYNVGYAAILKIYHDLELDRFFNNKARHEAFEYSTDSIMRLLVIDGILHPSSKKSAYERRGHYFERFDFALHHVYRALSHFSKIADACQRHISDRILAKYGRDTTLVYFDVTNVYFETDRTDNLLKRGKEKNNRPDPIVQIALAMDADGVPLYYKQFADNTNDSKTFIPVFKEVCVRFAPGRVIAVADMGCTSSDNIHFLKGGDRDRRVNGYVFSFSIRKGADSFKEYVLDDNGYADKDGNPLGENYDYKVKSRVDVREIKITVSGDKKKSLLIDEKQVAFWSRKYADRVKAERDEIVKKAHEIIADPKKHNKTSAHDAAAYIKNIAYDKKTGEVIGESGKALVFDSEREAEAARYDGYYCIVTSELDMPDSRVIEIYRSLSDIEDNFKVSKSNLELRPVYVTLEDHINAHILTRFISLVIMRLIQRETEGRFTPSQIIECLRNISCSLECDNTYLFDYRSDIADKIGEAFGIDFAKKRLALSKIKNIVAISKRGEIR